jgi:hypothetical protein
MRKLVTVLGVIVAFSLMSAVPAFAQPTATTTTILPSANPAVQGQAVTFIAMINGAQGTINTPTGTVSWIVNGVAEGSTSVGGRSPAEAELTMSNLPTGTFTVIASYSGDTNFSPSTGTVQETVGTSGTCTGTSGAPAITTQPANQTVPVGGNAAFTANACGSPTPNVLWNESTNGGATFFSTSVTSTTLTVTGALASQNGIEFEAVFTNNFGSATSSPATLTVTGGTALTVLTTSLPVGTVGAAYGMQLVASGGTPPYSWAVQSGTLPPGLTLSTGGLLSGTPTVQEVASFTVAVSDSSSPVLRATQPLSLVVNQPAVIAPPPPSPPTPPAPVANNCTAGVPAFVCQLYLDVLGRAADPVGLNTFSALIESGAADRTAVAFDVLSSGEYKADLVNGWYQTYLRRAADPGGLALNVAILGSSPDEAAQAGILGSPEYFSLQGSNAAGFIDGLYLQLLGRATDAGGLAHWEQLMANGFTDTQVAAAIMQGPEYQGDLVGGYYQKYLDRPVDSTGLSHWVAEMGGGVSDEQVQAGILGSLEFLSVI